MLWICLICIYIYTYLFIYIYTFTYIYIYSYLLIIIIITILFTYTFFYMYTVYTNDPAKVCSKICCRVSKIGHRHWIRSTGDESSSMTTALSTSATGWESFRAPWMIMLGQGSHAHRKNNIYKPIFLHFYMFIQKYKPLCMQSLFMLTYVYVWMSLYDLEVAEVTEVLRANTSPQLSLSTWVGWTVRVGKLHCVMPKMTAVLQLTDTDFRR